MTLEKVKQARREEALMCLVNIYRELQPSFVLSYSVKDPCNIEYAEAYMRLTPAVIGDLS